MSPPVVRRIFWCTCLNPKNFGGSAGMRSRLRTKRATLKRPHFCIDEVASCSHSLKSLSPNRGCPTVTCSTLCLHSGCASLYVFTIHPKQAVANAPPKLCPQMMMRLGHCASSGVTISSMSSMTGKKAEYQPSWTMPRGKSGSPKQLRWHDTCPQQSPSVPTSRSSSGSKDVVTTPRFVSQSEQFISDPRKEITMLSALCATKPCVSTGQWGLHSMKQHANPVCW
mmetsp:Transcript_33433/g.78158  ORF Transcript_33433/g.78158 Transcript_33433/m.78158 type:complete len:225 (+) Transcript_33433:450-1124(+)